MELKVYHGVRCLRMVTGFVVGPIMGCVIAGVYWDQAMILGVVHVISGHMLVVASKMGDPIFMRVYDMYSALVHMYAPMKS